MFNVLNYLELNGLNAAKTKLHVVRGDNAAKDWELSEVNPTRRPRFAGDYPRLIAAWAGLSAAERLLEAVRLETCWNDESRWAGADHIVVLLTVQADGSPYRHIEDGFLLMGILKVEGRLPGVQGAGTFEEPAWQLNWLHRQGDYLFSNPLIRKVPFSFAFNAAGADSTRAASFVVHGRVDATLGIPTPIGHRGFQLSFRQLQDRIYMANWATFLRPAGVYLIQVFDQERQEYYRYVGSARSITSRWRTYAETRGCGGPEEDGNVHLVALRQSMGDEVFLARWRIQVVRSCDTDEVKDVEAETKCSLCSYHLTYGGAEAFRSSFGLNGN